MNAIFWLAVFAAVCSYGYFFIQWAALWAISKGYGLDKSRTSILQYASIKTHGIFYHMQCRWFFLGIALTILAVNV